jgi:HAE1 family hydrophobic/amphiphilic exporter-1
MPLAIGVGTGAEIQAALARVVIGGLLASTLITLVLIPVVYLTTANVVARLDARLDAWRGAGATAAVA